MAVTVAYTNTHTHIHTYALWSNKAASGLFGYNQYFSETISICFFNSYVSSSSTLWAVMTAHVSHFLFWWANSAKAIKMLIAVWKALPRMLRHELTAF